MELRIKITFYNDPGEIHTSKWGGGRRGIGVKQWSFCLLTYSVTVL